VNTTTTSCKRRDMLLENNHKNTLRCIETSDTSTGRGLNGITSYYIDSFVSDVGLGDRGASYRLPNEATCLIEKMECFQFVFILVVMLKLSGFAAVPSTPNDYELFIYFDWTVMTNYYLLGGNR
jgi:hypothetical protein